LVGFIEVVALFWLLPPENEVSGVQEKLCYLFAGLFAQQNEAPGKVVHTYKNEEGVIIPFLW